MSRSILVFGVHLVTIGIFLPRATHGLVQEGALESEESWVFLSRFCFLDRKGYAAIDISYNVTTTSDKLKRRYIDLYLYYDDIWERIRANRGLYEGNCSALTDILDPLSNQIIPLYQSENCELAADGEMLVCSKRILFHRRRASWWYIALSSCRHDQSPMNRIKYKLLFMNDANDTWRGHLSADRFYIPEMCIGSLVIHIGLLFLTIWAMHNLESRRLLHHAFIAYFVAILLHCVGVTIMLVAYIVLITSGKMIWHIVFAADNIMGCSALLFMISLIIIGKGLGITRARIRSISVWKLVIFVIGYMIALQILCYIQLRTFSEADVVFAGESLPGYGLLILRVLAWGWFTYACLCSVNHNASKKKFFIMMWCGASIWFFAPVIISLCATHIPIDKWARAKVVFGAQQATAVFGHVAILLVSWPTLSVFPYTVRTTQIADLAAATGGDNEVRSKEQKRLEEAAFGGTNAYQIINTTANETHHEFVLTGRLPKNGEVKPKNEPRNFERLMTMFQVGVNDQIENQWALMNAQSSQNKETGGEDAEFNETPFTARPDAPTKSQDFT